MFRARLSPGGEWDVDGKISDFDGGSEDVGSEEEGEAPLRLTALGIEQGGSGDRSERTLCAAATEWDRRLPTWESGALLTSEECFEVLEVCLGCRGISLRLPRILGVWAKGWRQRLGSLRGPLRLQNLRIISIGLLPDMPHQG